ncbi:MAG: hydantoinase/oxoprolinase N-terminal domain-containing protein [Rhizobiaceae bacterium]
MTLLLGIDTGGTFTDAVLMDMANDADKQVVAKAKSLTTRQDFALGIAAAAQNVIREAGTDASTIGMVSLSTTLATNALVEGQGGRIAMIAIGFAERDLENAGLKEALGSDPVILLPGGHTSFGSEAAALDMTDLENALQDLAANVTGFAVAGYFAVRNPAHELAVRDLVIERTGKAVTCSHELSARLNGPKRALTTVLNARLVPTITRLIEATQRSLREHDITAPLMVVRGDGALVGSAFATRRPIETILSGPAASLVGAHYLTGAKQAFVNDIGGTTSDIAILENGRPRLDPQGASVGGYRTMVEAVDMHTFGLGGDSEVSLGGAALKPKIILGPRRLVPVSLIASKYPDQIHKVLDRQLKSPLNNQHDGRFVLLSGTGLQTNLPKSDRLVFDKVAKTPRALDDILQGTRELAALNRLVGVGLVQIAGLTPSDAIHKLGLHSIWDKEAADKALRLFARQRDGSGQVFIDNSHELAKGIVQQVQRRSAEAVLETALEYDGKDGVNVLKLPIIQEILDKRKGPGSTKQTVNLTFSLDRPLIGLGASAHVYHPQAAKLLDADVHVPDHADVANAIGAVVGQIMMKAEIVVSQPADGRFQMSGSDHTFADEATALEAADSLARARAGVLANEAGAGEIEISVTHEFKRANIESRDMLIEARVIASATGRPPIVFGDQTAPESDGR